MVSMLAAVALFVGLPQQPAQTPALLKRLKAQYSMADDIKKHFPRQIGMNTRERLDGYSKRVALEQDSITQALKWKCIGPEICSGRVIRTRANPKNLDEIYVAFATGGIWKTKDWGISWQPIFERQSSFGVGDFAFSASGKTIWVGTGENNSQRTSYQGTGVFRSDDGGKSWRHMGLEDTNHIGSIVVNPHNEKEIFVGALGHLWSANDQRGVFKSTDGGETWTQSLKIDELTGVCDLEMDPRNPQVLYATAWERDRRAWDFRDGGKGTAIYKTTNGGTTWTKLGSGLPSGDLGRIGLAIAPSKPDVVYAFIDNWNSDPDTIYDDEYAPGGTLTPYRFIFLNEDQFAGLDKAIVDRFTTRYLPQGTKGDDIVKAVKDKTMKLDDIATLMEKRDPNVFEMERVTHEIYRSNDAGKSWKRTHGYRFGVHGGYYFGEVRINPRDENDVWTLGTILLRSKDGGRKWTSQAPGVHVDFHDVYLDPRDSSRMIIGCDGGPYLSGDDGKTFRHLNNLPVAQVAALAVDNKIPYNVYVGMQDNGTLVGPSTYTPGRSAISLWKSIGGGDGSWIAVDPRDDGDTVFVASQWGAHQAINQKTNARWGASARAPQGGTPMRYQWISPLIISTHHPDIIYLGSQFVNRSFNQGRAWTTISPDLTTNRTPQGDVPYSTIKTLDESPLKFGLLIAGTDDGRIQVTQDGGSTWTDISTPAKKWVSRVLCSKYDLNTIYAAQKGHVDDDFKPYLWKSTDLGRTWVSIANNLPNEFVNSIKEDPADKNRLFVATGMGVYMSIDGGKSWEVLGGNLPHNPVHEIVIQPRDMELVAGLHGRSAWVFDLKQLDKLTPPIKEKPIHIFDIPTTAYSDSWVMRRTANYSGEPITEPQVTSSLWLKKGGNGVIRIKDKDGKVVKEKAFEAKRGLQTWSIELVLKPQGDKFASDNKTRPRTKVDEILADPFEAARGQYIKPGDYTIDIEVGDQKASGTWRMTG